MPSAASQAPADTPSSASVSSTSEPSRSEHVSDTSASPSSSESSHVSSASSEVPHTSSEAPPAATSTSEAPRTTEPVHAGESSEAELQAALDAEMERVDKELGVAQKALNDAFVSQRDAVVSKAAQLRRLAMTTLPERLAQVVDRGIEHSIAPLLLRTIRHFKTLASTLDDKRNPTDAYRAAASELILTKMDELVDVYDEMRGALRDALFPTHQNETELIRTAVTELRQQVRLALRTFNSVMEKTDFQATYYENEGWDSAMKKRPRFFREEMEEEMGTMSSLGEVDVFSGTAPDLTAETKHLVRSLNLLFREAEVVFARIGERLTELPLTLFHADTHARLLYDVHAYLDELSSSGRNMLREATLRLRDPIVSTRLALGLEGVPKAGLLFEVRDAPSPAPSVRSSDGPEAASVSASSTPAATTETTASAASVPSHDEL